MLAEYFLIITLVVTAILSAITLNRYKNDLQIKVVTAVILAVLHTIAGVICVKAFACLESLTNPFDAGMSLFGALFLLPLFYLAGSRLTNRDKALVFDDFCICVMIALMCVRCNCIVSGCCLGKVISGTGMFWPTRQIEIAFWAIMLIWFLFKKEHGYIKGILYPQMMMVYGIFRFIVEFFRDEAAVIGPFHFGHLWAVISFFVGSTFYFILMERKRP